LAATVYEQRDTSGGFLSDPHELTSPGLDSAEKVRDHLLELFIPAAVDGITRRRPDPGKTHRWLAVLAGYLDDNSHTGRSLGGPRSKIAGRRPKYPGDAHAYGGRPELRSPRLGGSLPRAGGDGR
jgi:hypothetical protein